MKPHPCATLFEFLPGFGSTLVNEKLAELHGIQLPTEGVTPNDDLGGLH
ncbi:hypothetical protein [Nitrosomonas sp.]|nr:hypothetical protein [Nitrosomonas sp.]